MIRKTAGRFLRWWFLNSTRFYIRDYNSEFANSIPKNSIVLDAGSGTAPYSSLFQHTQFETADFEQVDKKYAEATTYVCDLKEIPVENSRFDYILFNQVLEHVPDPLAVLIELNRVLKPNGKILCTCPFYYEEHEVPYDYYRYTQFGLNHLFDRAGFEVKKLEWLEGYFGTLAHQFKVAFLVLPWVCIKNKSLSGIIFGSAISLICTFTKISSFFAAGVMYRLDVHYKYTLTGMPKNYLVIGTKK